MKHTEQMAFTIFLVEAHAEIKQAVLKIGTSIAEATIVAVLNDDAEHIRQLEEASKYLVSFTEALDAFNEYIAGRIAADPEVIGLAAMLDAHCGEAEILAAFEEA